MILLDDAIALNQYNEAKDKFFAIFFSWWHKVYDLQNKKEIIAEYIGFKFWSLQTQ